MEKSKEAAELFGSRVEIVSGHVSRQKIPLIKDADKAKAEAATKGKSGFSKP